MHVTKPYKFEGFRAMYVTRLYKIVGLGAMAVTQPYKFISFGAMDVMPKYTQKAFGGDEFKLMPPAADRAGRLRGRRACRRARRTV